MDHVIVSVPLDEASDLGELSSSIEGAATFESRPFDGVAVAQVMVPLTIASIPVIKTWISNRYEHKKSQSVVLEGIRYDGYSADDIKQIHSLLDRRNSEQSQPRPIGEG